MCWTRLLKVSAPVAAPVVPPVSVPRPSGSAGLGSARSSLPQTRPPEPVAVPVAPVPSAEPAVASTAVAVNDEVVPFDNIRRRTADHMVRSKATSAHVYTSVEVDFEKVERARAAHKDEWKAREGFSLTYLPFIARAFCDTVHDFPRVNASVGDDALIVHHDVHLSIAVDLDFNGLVAPVIRNADDKRLAAIAHDVHDLALRARNRQLMPDDVLGGTFTITNPGPYGTYMTLPIINQPQVAIISTDTIKKRPIVVTGPDGDDVIAIHHIGVLALTWDHRVRRRVRRRVPLRNARRARTAELGGRARLMLRARWLGRVPYHEGAQLQRTLHERAADDYLLFLEHPHVYTLGTTADPEHVLVPPAEVGAELVRADRGGGVTYHGPGQLVGYPIVTLPEWRDGMRDVVAYVRALEDALIAALAALGVAAGREDRYTGVWAEGEEGGGDRREGVAGSHAPRLRAQRRSRSLDVRPHRAVRYPRPRRHVAGRDPRPCSRHAPSHGCGGGSVRRSLRVHRSRPARSRGATQPVTLRT